jgi:hypothetical protein
MLPGQEVVELVLGGNEGKWDEGSCCLLLAEEEEEEEEELLLDDCCCCFCCFFCGVGDGRGGNRCWTNL